MARAFHLKEGDPFYNYILEQIGATDDVSDESHISRVLEKMMPLIDEHRENDTDSYLRKHCPQIGKIFLPLDLLRALREYDETQHITKRKFVPPTFTDLRSIFNISVVHSIAPGIKLVTLDADDTIYPDGFNLAFDSPIIPLITRLLLLGCHVSLVTAAGYMEPSRYEKRISGLLQAFAYAIECGAPEDTFVKRFHVMGGECNYLLEPVVDKAADSIGPRVRLEMVPGAEWKMHRGRFDDEQVKRLLDAAAECLLERAEALQLPVTLIRKDRAVGIVASEPSGSQMRRLTYEVLEECALAVQHRLVEDGFDVPHCAFNGGHDVFIDIGNKSLGITALQKRVGANPAETVHAGDRFSQTGNDLRARSVANTLWVANPSETEYLLTLLISDMRAHRRGGSASTVTSPAVSDASPASHMTQKLPVGSCVPSPMFSLATDMPHVPAVSLDPFAEKSTYTPRAATIQERGIGSVASDHVPPFYGTTVEREHMEAGKHVADSARQRVQAAGGRVVAHVTPRHGAHPTHIDRGHGIVRQHTK